MWKNRMVLWMLARVYANGNFCSFFFTLVKGPRVRSVTGIVVTMAKVGHRWRMCCVVYCIVQMSVMAVHCPKWMLDLSEVTEIDNNQPTISSLVRDCWQRCHTQIYFLYLRYCYLSRVLRSKSVSPLDKSSSVETPSVSKCFACSVRQNDLSMITAYSI